MKLQLPRRGDSSDMSFIEFVDRFGVNPPFGDYFIFREGELRKARTATPSVKNESLLEELD